MYSFADAVFELDRGAARRFDRPVTAAMTKDMTYFFDGLWDTAISVKTTTPIKTPDQHTCSMWSTSEALNLCFCIWWIWFLQSWSPATAFSASQAANAEDTAASNTVMKVRRLNASVIVRAEERPLNGAGTVSATPL